MSDNVIRPFFGDQRVENLITELYEVIDRHAAGKMSVVTVVGTLDFIKSEIKGGW